MFVVDTNILIYAAIEEFPEHRTARELVEQWRNETRPWGCTWSIIYEFLRVVTHRSVFERPLSTAEAWSFIEHLMEALTFRVIAETSRHEEVLGLMIAEYPRLAGNIMHDLHTAALMKEHGVTEIRSADTDFQKFKFLRVVNPLGKRGRG